MFTNTYSPYLKSNTKLHQYKYQLVYAVLGSNRCLHKKPTNAQVVFEYWTQSLLSLPHVINSKYKYIYI
jgi:hypothetical protein